MYIYIVDIFYFSKLIDTIAMGMMTHILELFGGNKSVSINLILEFQCAMMSYAHFM